jgi:F0F1-type ATP synthase membrane subunit b/b'
MLNEGFWVFLAFIFLIGISFKYLKKNITSALDSKIKSVESSIFNAEEAKKSSNEKLLSLKSEYEIASIQYEMVIKEAKAQAENIINDTEMRIKSLDERSIEVINEYRKHSDAAMIESVKGDILMTILNLLENEQKDSKEEQKRGVENSLNVIKKIWN